MANKIKVYQCPQCGRTGKWVVWCEQCDVRLVEVVRDKRVIDGNFKVVGYSATRSGAAIRFQDVDTQEEIVMTISDAFELFKGLIFGLTLREVKHGSASSWEVLNSKEKNQ